jgi:hypothetical protein
LTSIEPINRTLNKKTVENNLKNMGTKCTQFHKSRKYFCSIIQGLNENIPKEIMSHEVLPQLRNGWQQWGPETSAQPYTKLLIHYRNGAWTKLAIIL